LTPSSKYAAVLLAALVGVAAAVFSLGAQPQGQTARLSGTPPMNPNLVVLDPAHGGTETGAKLGDNVLEKDITLAVMAKLKAALTAAGFTVVSTREADNPDPPDTDQRAEIANRAHAVACIVLHATATGSGVHVYTSSLRPPADDEEAGYPSAFVPIPWNMAQAAYVRQSQSLADGVSAALDNNRLPALVGQAPIRPLDNLMCPAVAIEMAPLLAPGVGSTPASDANYQAQLAATLTTALRTWRDSLQPAAPTAPSAQAVGHAAPRTNPSPQPDAKGPQ
jgi:N-acetylmuramoyl-L-alanine amidase